MLDATSVPNYYCVSEIRFLTGNPCTDYDGYREFVIGTLPQIDTLDGVEVTHYDKLVAKQQLSTVKRKIIVQQNAYEKSKREKKNSSKSMKNAENIFETDVPNDDKSDEDFWNQPSENTPECRVEMAMHSRRAQRKQDEAKKMPKKETRSPKLFTDTGRPYNLNQAKLPFRLDNEQNRFVLAVEVYKFMDTEELDVDVQPTYVRVTVRGKILQLVLDEEVKVDESNAKRLIGSKRLEITMPKVKRIISPVKKQRAKDQGVRNESVSKLTDDVLDRNRQVEFWNITNGPTDRKKVKDFIDNPDVPPLE